MEHWQCMRNEGMDLSNKAVQNETFIFDSHSARESNMRHVQVYLKPLLPLHTLLARLESVLHPWHDCCGTDKAKNVLGLRPHTGAVIFFNFRVFNCATMGEGQLK